VASEPGSAATAAAAAAAASSCSRRVCAAAAACAACSAAWRCALTIVSRRCLQLHGWLQVLFLLINARRTSALFLNTCVVLCR